MPERLVLYREITTEGVNGVVLVRPGSPTVIMLPDDEIWDNCPEPRHGVLEEEENVELVKGGWQVKKGKQAEIVVLMDPAVTEEEKARWLAEHGGIKRDDGWILTPEALPVRFVFYSLAVVDDKGNILSSPRANSPFNWPDRMTIRESYSVEG